MLKSLSLIVCVPEIKIRLSLQVSTKQVIVYVLLTPASLIRTEGLTLFDTRRYFSGLFCQFAA
jgi:hypothetical protein